MDDEPETRSPVKTCRRCNGVFARGITHKASGYTFFACAHCGAPRNLNDLKALEILENEPGAGERKYAANWRAELTRTD
jgi:hypothetical protein